MAKRVCPGSKIRSKGKGRGLGTGRGKGPLGSPYKSSKKRKYLPYRLTKEEKADPKLRKKLASCIKLVEKKACPLSAKKKGKYDYSKCEVNPVAVCRFQLKKSKKKKVKKS